MPLSVWYRPVVRLGGRTAAGAGQAIDCIWGISDCDAMMRSHDDGIAGGNGPERVVSACCVIGRSHHIADSVWP